MLFRLEKPASEYLQSNDFTLFISLFWGDYDISSSGQQLLGKVRLTQLNLWWMPVNSWPQATSIHLHWQAKPGMQDAIFCSPKGLKFFLHDEQFWQAWAEIAGTLQVAPNWKLPEVEESVSELVILWQNSPFQISKKKLRNSLQAAGTRWPSCMPHSLILSLLFLWISWAALESGNPDSPAHGPDSSEMGADRRLCSLPDPCPASHTDCIHSCLLNNTKLLV